MVLFKYVAHIETRVFSEDCFITGQTFPSSVLKCLKIKFLQLNNLFDY